jgi:hypothetical protein
MGTPAKGAPSEARQGCIGGSSGVHRGLIGGASGAHRGFVRARRGRIEASLETSVSQPPEPARLDQAAQGQSGASLGPVWG